MQLVLLRHYYKSGLTGVAMETMKPAAPIKLEAVQSILYKEVYHRELY